MTRGQQSFLEARGSRRLSSQGASQLFRITGDVRPCGCPSILSTQLTLAIRENLSEGEMGQVTGGMLREITSTEVSTPRRASLLQAFGKGSSVQV